MTAQESNERAAAWIRRWGSVAETVQVRKAQSCAACGDPIPAGHTARRAGTGRRRVEYICAACEFFGEG